MSEPTKTTDWAAWLRDNAPPGPLGRNMVSAANELDRLRTGLERLASPEAFAMSRPATEEETARMKYAEAVLSGANP